MSIDSTNLKVGDVVTIRMKSKVFSTSPYGFSVVDGIYFDHSDLDREEFTLEDIEFAQRDFKRGDKVKYNSYGLFNVIDVVGNEVVIQRIDLEGCRLVITDLEKLRRFN